MMAGSAKLVARHAIDARPGEPSPDFRDKARHDHRVHVGGRQQEAMDDVRAGQAEFYRRIDGDLCAIRSESELSANQTYGERTVALLRGTEIAFSELAAEMQRRGIDRLDIAGWTDRV